MLGWNSPFWTREKPCSILNALWCYFCTAVWWYVTHAHRCPDVKGHNWLLSLFPLIRHIHSCGVHDKCHQQIYDIQPSPISPDWNIFCCLLIITGVCGNYDLRADEKSSYDLSTQSTSTSRISFYQFSGDIINSSVWQNTKPVLKLWPCPASLVLLIKSWRFSLTHGSMSNEGDSACREKAALSWANS